MENEYKIALLGPAFTYTDFAVDKFCFNKGVGLNKEDLSKENSSKEVKGMSKITKSYFETIEDVFLSVEEEEVLFGVVPIENMIYGTVRESLDSLFIYNVEIISTITLDINHSLSVLPGVKLKDIKIVMSHSQALNQCKNFIKKYLPNVELVAMSSSAKAFEKVKGKGFKHIAVIGPKKAAQSYGFNILKSEISNNNQNQTKFIIFTKKGIASEFIEKTPKNMSIAFYFSNDKSGSLLKVFESFARNKINLTKIESRPYTADYGNYIFYIDFEDIEKGIYSEKVKKTLSEVESFVSGLKILGSY